MFQPTLPRERNLARVRSIYSRSIRKAAKASATYRANPNPGSKAAREDRILAAIAQRYRVAFVRVAIRADLRGAAKAAAIRKAARYYREALLRWASTYDRTSGWDAVTRTLRAR